MDIVSTKRCRKCQEEKASSEFNKCGSNKDGLHSYCRNCSKAIGKVWYKENAERKHEDWAKRYSENPDYYRARSQSWKKANPERVKQKILLWRLANPESVKAGHRNKRARRLQAPGSHSGDDIQKQFAAQLGKCWWCGVKLKKSGKGKYHVDHVVPLAKGGSNAPENLVCSCPTCNNQKHAKSALDFAGRLF